MYTRSIPNKELEKMLGLKEVEKMIMSNISRYDSLDDYGKHNYCGYTTDEIKEEFNHEVDEGWLVDISYNLDHNEKTIHHTISSILMDMYATNFFNHSIFDDEEIDTEQKRTIDWILEFTEIYNLFTVDNKLYIEL